MKYLIAFDKFKGAVSAGQATELAAVVIQDKQPSAEILKAPLTDGGEGFAEILSASLGGELKTVEVPGPRFSPVQGKFAMVKGTAIPDAAWKRLHLTDDLRSEMIGIVEMASASGYECLTREERDPWKTSTIGTGVLLKKAVEAGARAIILGIGGSATNDCGAGALEALGVCYYDRELQAVTEVTPEKLKRVNSMGSTSHLLNAFPPVRIACDVTNPLLGEKGATRVFGPQKGLKEEDFDHMERTMQKMGTRLLGLFGTAPTEWDRHLCEPGSGAAGGIGFALRHALPDSSFVEGFSLVADLLGLTAKIRAAGLVLTGEGRLDQSSLSGKGPVSLLRLADPSKSVVLLAGSVEEAAAGQLRKAHPNLKIIPVSDPDWPIEEALRKTPDALSAKISHLLEGKD